jgi:hypothetical protein
MTGGGGLVTRKAGSKLKFPTSSSSTSSSIELLLIFKLEKSMTQLERFPPPLFFLLIIRKPLEL